MRYAVVINILDIRQANINLEKWRNMNIELKVERGKLMEQSTVLALLNAQKTEYQGKIQEINAVISKINNDAAFIENVDKLIGLRIITEVGTET